jgi:hypothetical protein
LYLAISSFCLAISMTLLFSFCTTPLFLPFYSLTCLTTGSYVAAICVMVNSFPPETRFSGVACSYNLALAIFGGSTPVIISLASRFSSVAHVYVAAAASMIGCLLGVVLLVVDKKPPGAVRTALNS